MRRIDALTAANFIGVVAAVIFAVANVANGHALAVAALETAQVAPVPQRMAPSVVVFVTPVTAVVDPVADVVPADALAVVAGKSVWTVALHRVSCKIRKTSVTAHPSVTVNVKLNQLNRFNKRTALVLSLVRPVFAVVTSVANGPVLDAERVLALEHCLWTIPAVGEPCRAPDFVTQVAAILATVAAELLLDTMTAGTLEFIFLREKRYKKLL